MFAPLEENLFGMELDGYPVITDDGNDVVIVFIVAVVVVLISEETFLDDDGGEEEGGDMSHGFVLMRLRCLLGLFIVVNGSSSGDEVVFMTVLSGVVVFGKRKGNNICRVLISGVEVTLLDDDGIVVVFISGTTGVTEREKGYKKQKVISYVVHWKNITSRHERQEYSWLHEWAVKIREIRDEFTFLCLSKLWIPKFPVQSFK